MLVLLAEEKVESHVPERLLAAWIAASAAIHGAEWHLRCRAAERGAFIADASLEVEAVHVAPAALGAIVPHLLANERRALLNRQQLRRLLHAAVVADGNLLALADSKLVRDVALVASSVAAAADCGGLCNLIARVLVVPAEWLPQALATLDILRNVTLARAVVRTEVEVKLGAEGAGLRCRAGEVDAGDVHVAAAASLAGVSWDGEVVRGGSSAQEIAVLREVNLSRCHSENNCNSRDRKELHLFFFFLVKHKEVE